MASEVTISVCHCGGGGTAESGERSRVSKNVRRLAKPKFMLCCVVIRTPLQGFAQTHIFPPH